MSLLSQGQAPLASMESLRLKVPVSQADAEARRLAAAIARGDELAFRELYDRYHQRVFRLALVLARGDETLAEDVVQTVFVAAAEKLRSVEGEGHLWNWLARVARQHVAKSRRHLQKNCSIVGVAELPEFHDSAQSDSVLERSLDSALLAMEAEERQLIESFYFDRLSQKDIAERLNITPKAVSSRLERAREKLRSLVTRNLSHET